MKKLQNVGRQSEAFFLKFTELSHVGKLREVRGKLREVRGKLRDKCPTFYARRLLSLNFPNNRRE